jgi:hypothetical protein
LTIATTNATTTIATATEAKTATTINTDENLNAQSLFIALTDRITRPLINPMKKIL